MTIARPDEFRAYRTPERLSNDCFSEKRTNARRGGFGLYPDIRIPQTLKRTWHTIGTLTALKMARDGTQPRDQVLDSLQVSWCAVVLVLES
jgi:hypothetical protein